MKKVDFIPIISVHSLKFMDRIVIAPKDHLNVHVQRKEYAIITIHAMN